MVNIAIPVRAALIVLSALAFTACSDAQAPLKVIDNASGGTITYGRVDGQATEAGAMGAILQTLHRRYNDKPQVGRVFQVRGTNSAAVFFTLRKRTQDNAQLAGLVIASQTGLAGSTVIGDRVRVGGQAGFNGHITVGSDVTIAGGSGIWGNVEDGATISGNPAQRHRDELRRQVMLRKLPKLFDRVEALERSSSRPTGS